MLSFNGFALLLLFALPPERCGLRLTELVVPEKAAIGSSQVLSCGFVLERAKLYSVKWYKDEAEFYRFMPATRPQTRVFPVPGIVLDESLSDMHRVALLKVGTNTSGVYRCEVSTEGPNFDTVMSNANLSVFSFPDRDPEITVSKSYYTTTEYVTANCTSGLSYPPPEITWYINSIKMGKGTSEGDDRVGEKSRRVSTLTVRGDELSSYDSVEVGRAGGQVTLACLAEVPHDKPRRASLRINLDPPHQPKVNNLRQEQPMDDAAPSKGGDWLIVSILLSLQLQNFRP